MTLKFHIRARFDIIQAVAWYEDHKKGLGKRFNKSLIAAFKHIADSPLQFPITFEDFRKARIDRAFPFSIIYIIDEDTIYVIAVAHDKRDPDYWKERK